MSSAPPGATHPEGTGHPDVLHVTFNPSTLYFGTDSPLAHICAVRGAKGWSLHRVVPHTQYESVAVFVRAEDDVYDLDAGRRAADRSREIAARTPYPGIGRADPRDPESVFADFWEPIVAPGGIWDFDAVKAELCDYEMVIGEVARVYMHITEGRISKPTTAASAVIGKHDELWHSAEECEEDRKALQGAMALEESMGTPGVLIKWRLKKDEPLPLEPGARVVGEEWDDIGKWCVYSVFRPTRTVDTEILES